jgi:DNA (cytosine-5)-methyltransferase 1
MKILSLFSGVGGFDYGLEQVDGQSFKTAFQCEIDPSCQQVLQNHWPHVPKWDDVSTLTGQHILDMTSGVDVVAWGSPCQDLSMAGRRAGLSGERSGLFHQGIRIIRELRELSNGRYPTWSIWENVTGALSSNKGADFGEVLYEMDEAGACFSEWAVLDAQYFGVPQRRRRVFVVSCFNPAIAGQCSEPLLNVSTSRRRDTSQDQGSREDDFGTTQYGTREHSAREDNSFVVDLFEGDRRHGIRTHGDVAPTLQAFMGTGGNNVPFVSIGKDSASEPMSIRKLTPVECERLMGWPDNHTLHRADGKLTSDSSRYKMCGNGIVSPVAKWIGEHLSSINNNQGVPQ